MSTHEQNNADKPASEMTKRERMAMAAMQGLLADPSYPATMVGVLQENVRFAVEAADALLAELAKPKDGAK